MCGEQGVCVGSRACVGIVRIKDLVALCVEEPDVSTLPAPANAPDALQCKGGVKMVDNGEINMRICQNVVKL